MSMDLHDAITLVATDPAYPGNERGTVTGAVHSTREFWDLDDVATFTPPELATAYRVVLSTSEADIAAALKAFPETL